MPTASTPLEKRQRVIIAALVLVIVFFIAACTLNGVLPVCHYLFGCDHMMH